MIARRSFIKLLALALLSLAIKRPASASDDPPEPVVFPLSFPFVLAPPDKLSRLYIPLISRG